MLRKEKIPRQFWHLIPLAEEWAIGDDLDRDLRVERTERAKLRALVDAVSPLERELYEWLGGPEADVLPPTPEYVAFSTLGMAADYASAVLDSE